MRPLISLLLLFIAAGSVNADESSHEAAARRLLEVSRAADMVDTVYDSMGAQFAGMAEQMGIDESQRHIYDRHMERVFQVLREEMNWEKMEPYIIGAYTEVYSEQELSELADFYESPLGQKFLEKMPELMEATMSVTQSMMSGFYSRVGELEAELQADLEANMSEQQ